MGKKRVHKPDHDSHNEKHSREFARRLRNASETGETTSHRSSNSVVEGGENEKRGEPSRPGQEVYEGPTPLVNE